MLWLIRLISLNNSSAHDDKLRKLIDCPSLCFFTEIQRRQVAVDANIGVQLVHEDLRLSCFRYAVSADQLRRTLPSVPLIDEKNSTKFHLILLVRGSKLAFRIRFSIIAYRENSGTKSSGRVDKRWVFSKPIRHLPLIMMQSAYPAR